jgi:hypothetical protein
MVSIWIIKTKHIKPNGFYVKVDNSDFYTAYWTANTSSDQQAISLSFLLQVANIIRHIFH